MDDYECEVEESTPLLPEQQAGDLPQSDLEPPGPRPPSRRKRGTQLGVVIAAVGVGALLRRGVIAPSGSAPGGPAPTSQATTPPRTMLISSTINFGTVSLDGRRQRGSVPMYFVP